MKVTSVSLIPRESCHLLLRTNKMAAAISPATANRPSRCDAALCSCRENFSGALLCIDDRSVIDALDVYSSLM